MRHIFLKYDVFLCIIAKYHPVYRWTVIYLSFTFGEYVKALSLCTSNGGMDIDYKSCNAQLCMF